MKIEINEKWCKGCAICTVMCPKEVLKIENDKAVVVKEEECVGCKQCEYHCPDFAITVLGEHNG